MFLVAVAFAASIAIAIIGMSMIVVALADPRQGRNALTLAGFATMAVSGLVFEVARIALLGQVL